MALKRKQTANLELLTEEAKAKIEGLAKKKVEDERRKEAEMAYLDEAVEVERAKFDPALELENVLIDLPAYTGYLMIDGVQYNHGTVVEVTRDQAASIIEQLANCWEHEKLSGNPNLAAYKPVKHDAFSAKTGHTTFARV